MSRFQSPLNLKIAFMNTSISQEPHSQFQYHYPDNNIFKCLYRVTFILLLIVLPLPCLHCHLASFHRSHTVTLAWLYQHRSNYFIFFYAFCRGVGSHEICQFFWNKHNGNFWHPNGINSMSENTCLIFTSPFGFPEFINSIRIQLPTHHMLDLLLNIKRNFK